MTDEYEMIDSDPNVGGTESRKNRTIVIVLVIILVLCCCCIGTLVVGWTFGDLVVDFFSNNLNF